MYFQNKSGELLYVDVDQTLDLLQKTTEQEDFVTELMTSIGENHPSYHIFKKIDPSERMTRTGIIEQLVSILRKHDIYQQYPKRLRGEKGYESAIAETLLGGSKVWRRNGSKLYF